MTALTGQADATARATRVNYRVTISQDLARRLQADQLRPVTQADLERLLFALMAQGMGQRTARKVMAALVKARPALFAASCPPGEAKASQDVSLQHTIISRLHDVEGLDLDDVRDLSWPQVHLHLGEVVIRSGDGPVRHALSPDTLVLLKELKSLCRRARPEFLSTTPRIFSDEARASWTASEMRSVDDSTSSVTAA